MAWKILVVILILLAGGFFYLNKQGKLPVSTPAPQVTNNTTPRITAPQPVTAQNVDSTLGQTDAEIQSNLDQVDQDLKQLDNDL